MSYRFALHFIFKTCRKREALMTQTVQKRKVLTLNQGLCRRFSGHAYIRKHAWRVISSPVASAIPRSEDYATDFMSFLPSLPSIKSHSTV